MQATINGATINIPALRLPSGALSAAHSIDLTPYQGGAVRVYLSADGAFRVNPASDSYWQIAEVMLPPAATETVVTGTREDVRFEQRMIQRSEGDEDVISLAANEWIDAVGFSWARYVAGEDYALTPIGLTWLTERRPAADYMVDVAVATTVDMIESRALPLDLAAHAITLFNLPE